MIGVGGGSDWLGIGQVFSGMSQGTEMCGSKPLTGDKTAYETCVSRSIDVIAADQNSKNVLEQQKNKNKIIIVSLISASLLILAIVLIKRRKR